MTQCHLDSDTQNLRLCPDLSSAPQAQSPSADGPGQLGRCPLDSADLMCREQTCLSSSQAHPGDQHHPPAGAQARVLLSSLTPPPPLTPISCQYIMTVIPAKQLWNPLPRPLHCSQGPASPPPVSPLPPYLSSSLQFSRGLSQMRTSSDFF